MLIVFWCCAALIVYVYAGYPAALRFGLLGRERLVAENSSALPPVSIIVPAHNEEHAIRTKIENLLASDYPKEKIEILIGNDGSSDGTEKIVGGYAKDGVGLVSFPQQHGKSAIQNSLVALASGEVLVFTDADCLFAPSALRILVSHLNNPSVGLVTGRPIFVNCDETDATRNEGIYLRYETWLRDQESRRGLLAMASGSLFAMRRELWRLLDKTFGDDFALPLHVSRSSFLNVLEPRATATTVLTQNRPHSLFHMRVRIISKDLAALLANRSLLNPFRFFGISMALWSHKLLRWFVPYFLLALFISNLALLREPFFAMVFAMQVVFYAFATIGLLRESDSRVLSAPASFCVANAAAFIGTLNCLFGRTFALWKPTRTGTAPASVFESPGAGS
jgi:cellulose synthase/poly-beta-1,6-N-acetylglucosamine synthase-like glycosyltransferase